MSQVSTCSLTEAMYLLRRGNRIVEIKTECTLPYGHVECAFVFEGEDAQAGQDSYLRGEVLPFPENLPALFAAITEALKKGGTP